MFLNTPCGYIAVTFILCCIMPLCLKDYVLICNCNFLLIAAVLKESIGGRPFLCDINTVTASK